MDTRADLERDLAELGARVRERERARMGASGAEWTGPAGQRVAADDPAALRAYPAQVADALERATILLELASAALASARTVRAESEKVREAAKVAAATTATSTGDAAGSAEDLPASRKTALPPVRPDDAALERLVARRDSCTVAVAELKAEARR